MQPEMIMQRLHHLFDNKLRIIWMKQNNHLFWLLKLTTQWMRRGHTKAWHLKFQISMVFLIQIIDYTYGWYIHDATAAYLIIPPTMEYDVSSCDVTMGAITSQITSLTIVYSTIYSRRRSKKTSKLHVTGLCAENSPVAGEFPAQMASNAENVSIWWRHLVTLTATMSVSALHHIALTLLSPTATSRSGESS